MSLKSKIQSIFDELQELDGDALLVNENDCSDEEEFLNKASEIVSQAYDDLNELIDKVGPDAGELSDNLINAFSILEDIDFEDLISSVEDEDSVELPTSEIQEAIMYLQFALDTFDAEIIDAYSNNETVETSNSTPMEITLVGFQYHNSQDYIDSVGVGHVFTIQREPENEHDPKAVAVYDNGRLVAYVQKHDAHTIWNALKYPMRCMVAYDNGNYKIANLYINTDKREETDIYIAPLASTIIEPYTEDNLKALTETANEIVRFVNSLMHDNEVREMLENCLHNNADDPTSIRMMIKFVLGADISIIYKKLGHKIGIGKPEDLGAVLISYFMVNPSEKIDYIAGWKVHVDNMGHAARELQETSDGIFSMDPPNDFFFYIQSLLSNLEDESWVTRYMVLMYRFASLVAKADGKITKKEASWLAKIMQKPEPIMDEDNDEPIVMDAKADSDDAAINELQSLIGLVEVKDEITRLRSLIQIQKLRKNEGLPVIPVSRHFVFTGNPGTGKTTVARILAQIYKDLGVVKGGQLIETDRSGLVGEYVGQTAVKTNNVIDSALDGVLFIDEAYSLVQGSKTDFGGEAIATLLKRMEDNRDRLVVILAGYNNEMQQFIDSNPGLQSRFNRYINFPDYSADELMQIIGLLLKKNDFILGVGAEEKLKSKFEDAIANKTKNFGNARYARNVFEKILENQAVRLSMKGRITRKELVSIDQTDI